MKKYYSLVFVFLLMFTHIVRAEAACNVHHHEKITGIYSDMKYNKESGDVVGNEIFIVFSRNGYFAILQSSEGEPSRPVVVPVSVNGVNVRFSVPPDMDSRGDFQGLICNKHLAGKFSGNDQKINLVRKNSYWQ